MVPYEQKVYILSEVIKKYCHVVIEAVFGCMILLKWSKKEFVKK